MSEIPLAIRLQSANENTLHELMRETEVYLAAQLASAIAADQRAYTFAGTITAGTVLLIGGAYAMLSAPSPNVWLAVTSVGVAACLFTAAWMAVTSARAVDFEFAGNLPCQWVGDIESGKSLVHALAEQCAHYDGMALSNRETMERNSKQFNHAVNVALGSVGAGGISFVLWMGALLRANWG